MQHYLRNLFGRLAGRGKATLQRSRPPLTVEQLEARTVPTVWNVTSPLDNLVPGTLRYAVDHANNGDVIKIVPAPTAPVALHIALTRGELYLDHNLLIEGVGLQPTISGSHLSRVFEVAPFASVALRNLDISDGNGVAHNPKGNAGLNGDGGGILNEGHLFVTVCTLAHNSAENGGAIANMPGYPPVTHFAPLFVLVPQATVHSSTLVKNVAFQFGGGTFNEQGLLTVANCRLLFNSATLNAGGIANVDGETTVKGSLLFGNSAVFGGGIFNSWSTLTVSQTRVAGNVATGAGGGIYNADHGSALVTSCKFTKDTSPNGSGIENKGSKSSVEVGKTLFKTDTIDGLWTDLGGDVFVP
jgi:hypothetical protein